MRGRSPEQQAAIDAMHARFEADMKRDVERPAPDEPFPTVPPPPAYNSFAGLEQRLREGREVLEHAPDLRMPDRAAVDRMWAGLREHCLKEFGRAPAVESWQQPSDLALAALNAARNRESTFLKLAAAGAPPAVVDEAFAELSRAVATWVAEVTKGWPPVKEYLRQQARDREWY